MAEVLRLLGWNALVVTAKGVDERRSTGRASCTILPRRGAGGRGRRSGPDPGAARLAGGPGRAALVEAVLAGSRASPRLVLLNTAAAFVAAGRAAGLRDGIALAAQTIDTGAATVRLARLRAAKTARDAARPEAAPV
jgi:anthranilate phosphoribosyltransferase